MALQKSPVSFFNYNHHYCLYPKLCNKFVSFKTLFTCISFSRHSCGGQRTAQRSQFSSPIMCVLGIEHRWPGLKANEFYTLSYLVNLTNKLPSGIIKHCNFYIKYCCGKSRKLYSVRNSTERLNNHKVDIPKLK